MAARSSSVGSGVISSSMSEKAKAARGRGRWELPMGRRLFIPCLALLAALLASCSTAAAASKQPVSWAAPSIRDVAAAGLMGAKNVVSFRATHPLPAQTLANLVFDLKARLAPVSEPVPEEPLAPPV